MTGPNCATRWNRTTANHVIFIGLWREAFIDLWRIASQQIPVPVSLFRVSAVPFQYDHVSSPCRYSLLQLPSKTFHVECRVPVESAYAPLPE
jgi:hypothetical protein